MKNLITSILLLFLSTSVFAQTRTMEQVDENLYHYVVKDGSKTLQSGYYKLIDSKYEEHGIWRDHIHGTLAYFENGKMFWIKPKGKERYTYSQIELHRLRNKVKELEAIVALNDKP